MYKKLISMALVLSLAIIVLVSGCTTETTKTVDTQQMQQQEQMQKDMSNQIGLPDIKEWTEKKMAKEIYELRDNSKLITYAYFQNLEGKFIYLGQCIGFGLPYSTQYSNPEKYMDDPYGTWDAGSLIIPQAEPNGLFTPEGLSATWLQYINPETGKREVIYTEPSIVVTQSKLPRRLCAEWSLPANY